MKIHIIGTEYVSFSRAMVLAQHKEVVAFSLMAEKVDLLNSKKSLITGKEISDVLSNKNKLKSLTILDRQKPMTLLSI